MNILRRHGGIVTTTIGKNKKEFFSKTLLFNNNNNKKNLCSPQIRIAFYSSFNNNNNNKQEEKNKNNSVYNLPNFLTILRLAATPPLAYLIYNDYYLETIVGCFFTGVLDYFDGYFARKWNQQTILGTFLDPLADKVFIGTIVATLTYKNHFPYELFVLILARDVLLLSGSFVYRYFTKPKNVTFFNMEGKGTLMVEPSTISKVNTVFQMSILGFSLTRAAFGLPNDLFFTSFSYVVATTTILSGVSYLNLKNFKKT